MAVVRIAAKMAKVFMALARSDAQGATTDVVALGFGAGQVRL